ncbi:MULTISPECIES: MarC family protein [Brucella]|nr:MULTISPECIES: MarC family protein [Brucella]ERM87099.1 MarC family transcriptional regulator [Brucella abortus 82]ERT83759.1 hypothetical protein P050_01557 [Brucella abortus 90-12178]ERT97939.1 hypothetical protein P038_02635 [Brucella abortus 99-9971-135]EXU83305.1 MarC family transcriptional regulator [Brucella melitensis 548]KFH22107.1 MarC family transcriptional regulator [Brucella abortus LMN1]KFH26251.1 MarC family transcriptional regulator [Brucella abortus LMN2]
METGMIVGKLLPLLFNMMGPIGLMPIFAAMTVQMDKPTRNSVAARAAIFAALGILIAIFIGDPILRSWGISKPALILAAGVILTLSSIRAVLMPPAAPSQPAAAGDPKALAIRPLAFPTIVSPQGVGVLIIFVAFLSSLSSTITILTVAGVIVLLDYGAMRIAHWFMATVGMVPLLVLGAVFGVLQVALGIEMMLSGLLLVLNS